MENASEKYIEVIAYLGKLYDFCNECFFNNELEKPVITVQADTKNKALGWFVCAEVWKESAEDKGNTEINISAQFLNRPIEEIAETMLHEMVHQYAYVHKMQDCSRGGSYHNKLFKRLAEMHGLNVECIKQTGWSYTSLTPSSRDTLKEFVTENAFIYRLPDFKGMKVKSTSTRKYICPICGNSVRATKEVRIICADCNELMYEGD